ncbi:hypothetical protein SDJN03_16178, partial [Cucurbita argyrosperma subsp. sororia]
MGVKGPHRTRGVEEEDEEQRMGARERVGGITCSDHAIKTTSFNTLSGYPLPTVRASHKVAESNSIIVLLKLAGAGTAIELIF